MPYTPVTFVDGVTPLNAATFNQVENGVEALDALPKIPTPLQEGKWLAVSGGALAWLPAPSGVDYEGAWAAATPYVAGDVVRYNGVDYLAVNPSTGVTPPGAAPGGIGYGTSLPASPVDGQEHVLVDSLTAPTYAWRFRYTAGVADAYKWVFVGGAPLATFYDPSTATSATTFAPMAGGPSVAVPRAGIYTVRIGARCTGDSVIRVQMSFAVGAAAAVDADGMSYVVPDPAAESTCFREATKTIAAAAMTVETQYKTNAGVGSFSSRSLAVLPVRVS